MVPSKYMKEQPNKSLETRVILEQTLLPVFFLSGCLRQTRHTFHRYPASQFPWPGEILRPVKMIKRETGKLLGQIQLFFFRFCTARDVDHYSAPKTTCKKTHISRCKRGLRVSAYSKIGDRDAVRIIPLEIKCACADNCQANNQTPIVKKRAGRPIQFPATTHGPVSVRADNSFGIGARHDRTR